MPRTPIASCNTRIVSYCIPRARESQLECLLGGFRECGRGSLNWVTDVVRGNLRAEEVVLLDHVDERQGTEVGEMWCSCRGGKLEDAMWCVWHKQKPKTSQVVELRPGNSRNFASNPPSQAEEPSAGRLLKPAGVWRNQRPGPDKPKTT